MPSETASRRQRSHARTRAYRPFENRSCPDRKIAEGTFPAQLKISTNGTGWHESAINSWIEDPVSWRPKREFDEVR